MFKKLFPFIKGYERQTVLAPLLVILETICELLVPLVMARIIDVGIHGSGGTPYILKMGAVLLALALFAMLTGVLSTKFSSDGSYGFGANLRGAMFNKIQEFSFADIDKFSSASLITRMTNDISNIQNFVTMGLRMLFRAPIMLIVALLVCFSMDVKLTLVLIAVIPVMVISAGFIMSIAHKLFELYQTKLDALNASLQENLIAIRVVKAFVREAHEKAKFKAANDDLTNTGISVAFRFIWIMPVMMVCFNVAIAGVLWFGGQYIIEGTMLTGDLYSFISYIFNILISIMMLAMTLFHLVRASASAGRIVEVLDTAPDICDGSADTASLPEARGGVEFCDVSFRYTGGSGDDVLSGINLKIEPGEFVAIIGGTGVGKSSLVNLIPRFYDAAGGAVLVDGLDVREYPVSALRERIGMVLQNNVLFSGTIRENLLWGAPKASEAELIEAAKSAQAYDFIMSFPEGFDTFIEQGGVNVSGGQKQRLCIARAMLKNPAILILDDSTSAVDSATEAKIRDAFSKSMGSATIIIIAQRISSVRYADKIVILDDDHIADIGCHDELMERSQIYREIYQSQQEGVKQ